MKTRAQTDRVWTNLRQGRGTVKQQNLMAEIVRHPMYKYVKITKLINLLYHPSDDSLASRTRARTEALQGVLKMLEAMSYTTL